MLFPSRPANYLHVELKIRVMVRRPSNSNMQPAAQQL